MFEQDMWTSAVRDIRNAKDKKKRTRPLHHAVQLLSSVFNETGRPCPILLIRLVSNYKNPSCYMRLKIQ